MSNVSIIGAHNTKFGAFAKKNKETKEITDQKSFYELLNEAAQGAIENAGLTADDIDAVWVGSCSPGLFIGQDHIGPLSVEAAPEGLRLKPTTRTEGACASSSLAIYDALYSIEAGRNKTVLVIGVEKMSLLNTKGVTYALGCSSYAPEESSQGMTFPGLFAEYAKGYAKQYNLSDEYMKKILAAPAAQMYRNGIKNPLAQMGEGSPADKLQLFTTDAILNLPEDKNPVVAEPLRLHDCSLISDGAAAVVLASEDIAKTKKDQAVRIAGIGHTTERLPISRRPNMYEHMAGKEAAKKAYSEAGITADDIDIVELHDCFTINHLISTETLGFSKDGQAGQDYLDGRFGPDDPQVSINLSGGLKAKGHPVGATGVSMHALTYFQLIGQPVGVAPKKQPKTGVVFNVGGSAVTNCITVLQR